MIKICVFVLVFLSIFSSSYATYEKIYPYKVMVYDNRNDNMQVVLDTVVLGVSHLDDPIDITVECCEENSKSLYCFISSLVSVYRGFLKKEDLDGYTYVSDDALYQLMWGDDESFNRIKSIYNNTRGFEYHIGWFISPVDFIAVLKRKSLRSDDDYYVAMPFTIRTGEWKILSGIRLSQPDAANVLRALMYVDSFQMRVDIATPSDVLFELSEDAEDMF